jgi:hypothetical protein
MVVKTLGTLRNRMADAHGPAASRRGHHPACDARDEPRWGAMATSIAQAWLAK